MKRFKQFLLFTKIGLSYILISAIIFICIVFVSGCNFNSGKETTTQPKTYVVEFGAQEGGKLIGDICQTVNEGESTKKVIAVADMGYYFAGWADIGINNDETIFQDERVITDITEDRFLYAMFEKITLQVEYIAGEHGNILGELVQRGKYGDDTLTITAIPNIGYRFVGWSDGLTEPTRVDKFNENKQITANFEVITNEYTYNYKFADSNCDEKSIYLTYGQLDNISFIVPQREHAVFGGWYADRYLTQQVSDENGNIVIGNEIIFNDSTNLYAKWITENSNTYKILIVYVTELNAELTKKDMSGTVQVNYKMTDLERRICQMLTEKIFFELNDLAVSNFQVDEYFTTSPLSKENMREFYTSSTGTLDNSTFAMYIPEIQNKLKCYDSVLISFSMDDYFGDLHTDGGEAINKFGTIHFDGCLTQLIYYHESIESLLNPLHYYWDQFMDTYLHELAHTIELNVNNMPDFHKVVSKCIMESEEDKLRANRLYFLNKAIIDGKSAGIPYEFWEGKVATVHYEAQSGGRITYVDTHHNSTYGQNLNDDIQRVLYGDNAIKVEAIAFDGYEFAGWSDGVETTTRQDLNIMEDLHVYAIFKLKDVT